MEFQRRSPMTEAKGDSLFGRRRREFGRSDDTELEMTIKRRMNRRRRKRRRNLAGPLVSRGEAEIRKDEGENSVFR